MFYRIISK